jgi:hypothetical protein
MVLVSAAAFMQLGWPFAAFVSILLLLVFCHIVRIQQLCHYMKKVASLVEEGKYSITHDDALLQILVEIPKRDVTVRIAAFSNRGALALHSIVVDSWFPRVHTRFPMDVEMEALACLEKARKHT